MIYYTDIYSGSDIEEARKKNLVNVASALSLAKSQKDHFVLVSSSSVFDRTIERSYSEDDLPNSTNVSSKFLIEAEKIVVKYDFGYVMRVQDKFEDLYPVFETIKNYQGTPCFNNDFFNPLLDENIKLLMSYAVFDGKNKIVHICSPDKFSLHCIWYLIRGENCDIGNNSLLCAHKGYMVSKILN